MGAIVNKPLGSALPPLAALALVWWVFHWWTLGFAAFTSYSYVVHSAAPLPKAPPNLTLVDQSGNRWLFGAPGRGWQLVTFLYLDCSGTCPAALAAFGQLNQALKSQGLQGLRLLTITLAPDWDRREVLERTWQAFGSPPDWQLAAPEGIQLQAYWQALRQMGMWVEADEAGTPLHDDRSYLLDDRGRIVASFAGIPSAATLQGALDQAAQ